MRGIYLISYPFQLTLLPPSLPPSLAPSLHPLRYLDGSTQVFQPEHLDVVEMLSDMHQHAHVINAKYEDEGKELDA